MPALFPPLKNETPISGFASETKAVVREDGAVVIKSTPDWPDPVESVKNDADDKRLRIVLEGHDPAAAKISQRYTEDSAPVVQTDYLWPDLQLTLFAFADEPAIGSFNEADGFYVLAKISASDSSLIKPLSLRIVVENGVDTRLKDGREVVDARGRPFVRTVAVTEETHDTHSVPRLRVPTRHTAGFGVPVVLNGAGRFALALQLPLSERSGRRSAQSALETTNQAWRRHLEAGLSVSLPDARLQLAWDANVKQLGMMLAPQPDGLRILKGLGGYYGSNPYDTLQGSLILDRLGFPELAEALLRRQLKRVRPDGIFEMWEKKIPPALPVQWIVQGLAPLAIWKHYEMTQDRRWLEEAWPTVLRSVKATSRELRKPSASGVQGGLQISGLMPPGVGDGGVPSGYTLGQNLGPLTGIAVAIEMARVLQAPEQPWLQCEYSHYRERILAVMEASKAQVDGFGIVPSYFGATTAQAGKATWGVVMGVYPFAQFTPDDPLVLPTLRYLQAHKRNGLYRYLGYSQGVWPYMSAAVAHWQLRLGEFDEAFQIQQAILDHASPTWGWYEEIEDQPIKGFGDIPDVWQACELLNLTRELLVLEIGDTLLLAPAIPSTWSRAGNQLRVDRAPGTLASILSYQFDWKENAATARIQLKDIRDLKRLRLKLLPQGKPAAVTVTGATLDAIHGRFIELSHIFGEVEVAARW